MNVTVEKVYLFNVVRNKQETAELWHAITEQQLIDWKDEWVLKLLKVQQQPGRDDVEQQSSH